MNKDFLGWEKFTYVYLEPGYYARFDPNGNGSIEVYNKSKDEWQLVEDLRLLRKLNQDSSLISYHAFLHKFFPGKIK